MIRILHYIKRAPDQGDYMKTEFTLRLSDIMMQTERVHLQIEAPLLGIVYLLVET